MGTKVIRGGWYVPVRSEARKRLLGCWVIPILEVGSPHNIILRRDGSTRFSSVRRSEDRWLKDWRFSGLIFEQKKDLPSPEECDRIVQRLLDSGELQLSNKDNKDNEDDKTSTTPLWGLALQANANETRQYLCVLNKKRLLTAESYLALSFPTYEKAVHLLREMLLEEEGDLLVSLVKVVQLPKYADGFGY